MRTKTRAARYRFSTSPHKPPPAPSASASATATLKPLPFPNLYDDNEQNSVDNIVPGSSTESSDDSVDEDWLEVDTCLKCSRSGQDLLVCCEIGCPVAIHEKCYQFKPNFDELRKFYCPYCWHRRELARTKELREKAMLAKKALSDFIDFNVLGNVVKEKESDTNVTSLVGERNCTEHSDAMEFADEEQNQAVQVEGNQQIDGDSAKQADGEVQRVVVEHEVDPFSAVLDHNNDVHHTQEETTTGIESPNGSLARENVKNENIAETHEFEVSEGEEGMQEVGDGQLGDGQDVGILKDAQNAEPLNVCCIKAEQMDCNAVDEGNQEKREEEEQMHWDVHEATVSFTKDDAAEVSEMSDSDFEIHVTCQKRAKKSHKKKEAKPQNADSPNESPFQKPTIYEKKSGNQKEKVSPFKKSRKSQDSAKKSSNLKPPNERRKRLHWTPEEEEMLKEAVQIFSTAANKNLPWRKILEFGHHVFDATRTPIDLKDKWRNIGGQRVLNDK